MLGPGTGGDAAGQLAAAEAALQAARRADQGDGGDRPRPRPGARGSERPARGQRRGAPAPERLRPDDRPARGTAARGRAGGGPGTGTGAPADRPGPSRRGQPGLDRGLAAAPGLDRARAAGPPPGAASRPSGWQARRWTSCWRWRDQLRPAVLDDHGLVPALHSQVRDFARADRHRRLVQDPRADAAADPRAAAGDLPRHPGGPLERRPARRRPQGRRRAVVRRAYGAADQRQRAAASRWPTAPGATATGWASRVCASGRC